MVLQNKKRILYLRTDIGAQDLIGGGSVAHTLGVLKGFTALNCYVVCVSTAMHSILQKKPINFIPLVVPRVLQRLGFKLSCLFSNILFYFKLKKYMRKQGIEMIYQRYSMLNCVGVALAHRFKIPLYLEYNGSECWVDRHWSPKRRLKIDWLLEKIELLNLKHATKIIVVSQVLKEQLLERGIDAQKIFVCPNGVDLDMYDSKKLQHERDHLRTGLAVQEKFIFGFSGTFGPWHGIDVLAYLIPRIVQQNEQAHFLLIGDGQLKQMLYDALAQAQVLDCVTFTGMVPSERVPGYLAMCDAFLCPTQKNPDGSRFFGSPTKLFEYMAAGRPIIASDLEQIGNLLRQDGARFLVKPGDHEGFVHAAHDLLQMPDNERSLLGKQLQQRAVLLYNWQTHVESFV